MSQALTIAPPNTKTLTLGGVGGERYIGVFVEEDQTIWLYRVKEDGEPILTNDKNTWTLQESPANIQGLPPYIREWATICWTASSNVRISRQEAIGDNQFLAGLMDFATAARLWGKSISALKKDATQGRLGARKLGGAWITTKGAMIAAYGDAQKPTDANEE